MVSKGIEKLPDEGVCENELEPESLAHRVVNLNSKFSPGFDEKKRYQCADIVKHIIEFDSSIKWSVETIMQGIEKAESNDFLSAELSELREATTQYFNTLNSIQERATLLCYELAEKTLIFHGIKFNVESDFFVDGYHFKATPITEKINYVVSDLFSYSDIANINMSLVNVTVTGDKKLRKTQLPTHLIMNLWNNN